MPPAAELARLLDCLRPAELALRDWVRPLLTTSIVREMAQLDHGMQADEHRRGIEELLTARRLPSELPWNPREVLELFSFCEPDNPRAGSGMAGRRGHVARLFSCLVLVRADDTLRPAGTLAALVESALELGPEATGEALRYLAWCRLREPGAWRDDIAALPFLTLGLLILYLMASPRHDEAIVAGLTRACVDEVEAALARQPEPTPSTLLRARAGGQGWRTWRALAARCETMPLRTWF